MRRTGTGFPPSTVVGVVCGNGLVPGFGFNQALFRSLQGARIHLETLHLETLMQVRGYPCTYIISISMFIYIYISSFKNDIDI